MLLSRSMPERRNSKPYLLTLLVLILAFNYVDRLALGLTLQDIKAELALSDTQLGVLSGIAFALFYAVMGIPIARWADRGSRVTVIATTAAIWSVAVALCGFVKSFPQLLAMRVAVAIGEAGCVPPAHSLIADSFSRAERPRAFSHYMLGAPLSCLIGYFAAGWLNQYFGWRVTFMAIGAPGLILAALAWYSLVEPRRQAPAPEARAVVGLGDVARVLGANRTFRHLLAAFSVSYFLGYGITQWQPTFFIRSYGLQTGELGVWFTLITGVVGFIGTYLGGEWATRRAEKNEGRQLAAVAIVFGVLALFSVFVSLSRNYHVAFLCIAIVNLCTFAANGPLFAIIQSLVPARMRATAIAILYLFANLIGMGLGPLLVGALSDALRPAMGPESLRYALAIVSPGYLWCAWHFWRARRTVRSDLRPTD